MKKIQWSKLKDEDEAIQAEIFTIIRGRSPEVVWTSGNVDRSGLIKKKRRRYLEKHQATRRRTRSPGGKVRKNRKPSRKRKSRKRKIRVLDVSEE